MRAGLGRRRREPSGVACAAFVSRCSCSRPPPRSRGHPNRRWPAATRRPRSSCSSCCSRGEHSNYIVDFTFTRVRSSDGQRLTSSIIGVPGSGPALLDPWRRLARRSSFPPLCTTVSRSTAGPRARSARRPSRSRRRRWSASRSCRAHTTRFGSELPRLRATGAVLPGPGPFAYREEVAAWARRCSASPPTAYRCGPRSRARSRPTSAKRTACPAQRRRRGTRGRFLPASTRPRPSCPGSLSACSPRASTTASCGSWCLRSVPRCSSPTCTRCTGGGSTPRRSNEPSPATGREARSAATSARRRSGSPASAARPDRRLRRHRLRRDDRRPRRDAEQVRAREGMGRARPGPIDDGPLVLVERAAPNPGRARSGAGRGVRRVPHRPPPRRGRPRRRTARDVVPGHEIVGIVDAVGPGATRFEIGDRVGIAVAARTPAASAASAGGATRTCASTPRFTGWDADGGYAEHAVVDERYAYRDARRRSPTTRPRRCCARASSVTGRCAAPSCRPAAGSASTASAASAHLAAQVALAEGATVHVMTRSADGAAARARPRRGVGAATRTTRRPSRSTRRSCSRRPARSCRRRSRALDRGGTLAIAGIHLSDIPPLDYAATCSRERQLRSVTANTRRDGEEFLALATEIPLHVQPVYAFAADEALRDLAHDRVTGAAVLKVRQKRPGRARRSRAVDGRATAAPTRVARHPQQHVFTAVRGDQLHADGQTVSGPVQRQRDRGLAGHVEGGREGDEPAHPLADVGARCSSARSPSGTGGSGLVGTTNTS